MPWMNPGMNPGILVPKDRKFIPFLEKLNLRQKKTVVDKNARKYPCLFIGRKA